MNVSNINLRRADLLDAKQFAYIKAKTYADDKLKSMPDEDNVPEWYNGCLLYTSRCV